jgi:hypothetical protein
MSTGTEHGWWEWVFSGAGVMVVGGIIRWLYLKFFKPKPLKQGHPLPQTTSVAVGNGAQANSLATGNGASVGAPVVIGSNNTQQVTTVQQMHYHAANVALPILERSPSTPTPTEIFDSLKDTAPYQRQKVAQDYVGLPVKWHSCRVPLVDELQVETNGDKAKLFWNVSLDGKKIQSETYKIIAVSDAPK